MESDNSSMDGEVDTHWRESLDTKNNHVPKDDQYSGKGPKSPPENNDLEATSPVSSGSSVQGSPRSQTAHSPVGDSVELNGDNDVDDRLSLSPEPEDRQSLEASEQHSRSPSPVHNLDPAGSRDKDTNSSQHSSPGHSGPKSPSSLNHHSASPEPDEGSHSIPKKSLAEDLSDVSDIESLDGNDEDILNAEDKQERTQMNGGVTMTLAVTEEEQLDFEEEQEEEGGLRGGDREEEGDKVEASPSVPSTDVISTSTSAEVDKKKVDEKEEGEEGELEEGEVSDEGEARPEESEPRPLCRFFSRGACTWGSSCRFLHPGVTDKGHYSMFDMIRPMAAPPPHHPGGMYHPSLRPPHPDAYGGPTGLDPRANAVLLATRKEDAAVAVPGAPAAPESAWERGLRQAKEILKKSTKRKETEVDFEEKKMNLTLGQDELDKENDYYTRSASPALSPSPERVLPPPRKEYDHLTKAPAHPHYLPPGEDYLPPHHPGALHHDPYYRPPMHHPHDPYWPHHRPLHHPPHPYDDPHRVYARPRYGGHPPEYYGHPPGSLPPPHHPHDLAYDPSAAPGRSSKAGGSSASGAGRHGKPAREVIVQRVEKATSGAGGGGVPPSAVRGREGGDWKEERDREREMGGTSSVLRGASFETRRRDSSPPVRRTRADEWADPWMRSKSPGARGGDGGGAKRRTRHSSDSSYTSSSSRSSSSRSTYSSYSDSRSRSRSPAPRRSRGGDLPTSSSRKQAPLQFKLSPSSRKQVPRGGKPSSPSSLRLSNKLPKLPFAAASPSDNRRVPVSSNPGNSHPSSGSGGGVPPRLLAQAKATVKEAIRFSSRRGGRNSRASQSRSSSSSPSSSSSSSSSSSEEEDSSSGESSSSPGPATGKTKLGRPAASPLGKKAAVAPGGGGGGRDRKENNSELMKLAGQKAAIKLNLASDSKPSAAKKRPADDGSPNKTPPPPSKKGVPSRREELLKQLKAVEDAIAKKRSKI